MNNINYASNNIDSNWNTSSSSRTSWMQLDCAKITISFETEILSLLTYFIDKSLFISSSIFSNICTCMVFEPINCKKWLLSLVGYNLREMLLTHNFQNGCTHALLKEIWLFCKVSKKPVIASLHFAVLKGRKKIIRRIVYVRTQNCYTSIKQSSICICINLRLLLI